jgi:hypothetical protein
MAQYNIVATQASYVSGSNSNMVTCEPGYLLVPQQVSTGSTAQQLVQIVQATSHVAMVPASSGVAVQQQPYVASTNCVGISTGELLQPQLIAQAPAGSFTAADGCFMPQYTPAQVPMAPATAEHVLVTEETAVQLECMVLQQQLAQKQQLAQQLAQHRVQVQPQQQVITLQPQLLPQQAPMAAVYASSAGSNTVQLLQPEQQQLLLGVAPGSAACGFNIESVDSMFGSSYGFASACNFLNPASTSEALVQVPLLQAQQQQQQQGALDGAAAALQLLPSSSSDGMLLAAVHSQDSLGSSGDSYCSSGSGNAADTASGDSRAGVGGLAGTGVFFPPSLDKGTAQHGSSSGHRNNTESSFDRDAAPQNSYNSDRSTGRGYGAAYGSRSGNRDPKEGSWRRRDGVLVVPCSGKNSPCCGPVAGAAAAAAYNARGAAAAPSGSAGCGSRGGDGGWKDPIKSHPQQQHQQQRWGRSQQRGFWPRAAPHSGSDKQSSTHDQMSFYDTIMSKSKSGYDVHEKQQLHAQLPRRSVGRYKVSLLSCSGGMAGIDLEQLCSSASMSTDIIEPLGGYRRRTVDVVQNQQYGHLSTRARRDMTARSSGIARSSDGAPGDDGSSRSSNAGDAGGAKSGSGFGTPRSQSYRASFEAASAAAASSAAVVAEAAAMVAAFAAAHAAAEGEQPTMKREAPAGVHGGEPTESAAAITAADAWP